MRRTSGILAAALALAFAGRCFAAPHTFDTQVPDGNYGSTLTLDELTYQSENGSRLSVTNASSSGLGAASSLPNKLSTFATEPPPSGQRTSLTVRFEVPAKFVDFWLTGTSFDTTIQTFDSQNNLLSTLVRTPAQTGQIQITASTVPISKLFIQPSAYDGFSIDNMCYQADAVYSEPLVDFEYPGYSLLVVSTDLTNPIGFPRSAHDGLGNFYFPSRISGEPGVVIRRRTPTGSVELFARVNAAYDLRELTFDPEGNMVLLARALGCPPAGAAALALVRVTGFGSTPSPTPVATPTISPNGGTFTSSVNVTLATTTSGADIRYTLDGSTPTNLSALYTGPIPITASATLKAKGFKSGSPESGTASADFVITASGGGTVIAAAANTSARSSGWSVTGTEIYAWSSGTWLEYLVDFGQGGGCTFTATAINRTNPSAPGLPGGFNFNLTVQVDGVNKGTLQVPGSGSTYRTGSLTATVPSGVHNVRFTWTNDVWTAGLYDSNLQVRELSFSPASRVINTALLPRVMPAGDSITTGVGDSNSFGYRDHLITRLGFGSVNFVGTFRSPASAYTFDLDNEGLGGDRADQLEARLPYALVTAMPTPNPAGSKVLVHIGTNDLGQGVANSTIVQNVDDIVDIIDSYDPSISVYVALIVPNTNSADDALITSFNSALAARVAQLQATKSNLYLVDMNSAFKQNASWRSTYFADEVHPNDAGYQVMAAEWERLILP
jgi:lysophospholipase L1-like esterase